MTTQDIPKLAEIAMLKGRLLALPEALYKARQALNEASSALATIKKEMAQGEAEALLLVSGALNEAGKPIFSNEAARSAAVKRHLQESAERKALATRLRRAESDRLNAELTLKRLEDEHKAWRAVVDITVSEITLLCHGR